MAEIYTKGTNRIWYRPRDFVSGLSVTLQMRKPNGNLCQEQDLVEVDTEGVYFIDYNFDELGQWLGIIKENNTRKTSTVFQINPVPVNLFVTYNSKVNKG